MIARDKLSDFWLTWPLQWPLSFLVTDSYSPESYIQEIKIPKIFIHSKQDKVVPYYLGEKLYNLASQPKELWVVPWAGHANALSTSQPQFRIKFVQRLCDSLVDKSSICPLDP